MEENREFEEFQERLNVLDAGIRARALELASEIYAGEKCTREEALEKGITQAELENRNI
ncbi:hypothetical protein [Salinimicrobium sp. HB62]|uniref:hypothetical protein n=1 Tax=Salinimicrobium sp. HB62 TaxID=3077781 RepID=UPI002D77EB40|nr:hypothetical protein [Salinimicrobium sp. HB62]